MTSTSQQKDIDINTLTPQELAQLKQQLDEEITTLNNSYAQLKVAISKFKDSHLSLSNLSESKVDEEMFVPLTASLYVPGKLGDVTNVTVEVGAGYYVEQKVDKAKEYCDRRIKLLSENTNKLAEIIEVKRKQQQMVVYTFQQKVAASKQQA